MNRLPLLRVLSSIGLALLGYAAAPAAENIVFPAGAKVRDITKPPFLAKNDGSVDVTEIIRAAIRDTSDSDVGPLRRQGMIVYFPNGTYLVSDTIEWGTKPDQPKNRVTLQGQSTEGTVIKLTDNNPRYQMTLRPVIRCGQAPAQAFNNEIRNLTLNVGRANPRVEGLRFMSNNTGCVRHVRIVSEDGKGYAGLNMAFSNENGPLLIKDLYVKGFEIGIVTGLFINSQTLENITLEGQTKYGISNGGQPVSIRNLVSINSVPVLLSSVNSLTVLVKARLTGTGAAADTSAIVNTAGSVMYACSVVTQGYKNAITNLAGNIRTEKGPAVPEFTSHTPLSLFPTPLRSLGLPFEETPDVPWDDTAQWANVMDYGAIPEDKGCDAEAIQAAIDAGKPTVYFPHNSFFISAQKVVHVRGKVRRIIGCTSFLDKGFDMAVLPAFRLSDGEGEPVVVFERITAGAGPKQPFWEQRAKTRTLVIKDAGGGLFTYGGKVFLENFGSGDIQFRNTSVWARQVNVENTWDASDTRSKILNDGGKLWLLGIKTERDGSIIYTRGQGYTELLGGFSYSTRDPLMDPMFINELSSFSAVFTESRGRGQYDTLVAETRTCTTDLRYLTRLTNPAVSTSAWTPGLVSRSGATTIPLYVGYCPDGNCGCAKPGVLQGATKRDARVGMPSRLVRLEPGSGTVFSLPAGKRGIEVYDARGSVLWHHARPRSTGTEKVPYTGTRTGLHFVRYLD